MLLYLELSGFDFEGARGYFLHPPRRLQSAAECEKMRRDDLCRDRRLQKAQQMPIRSRRQTGRMGGAAQIARRGAHRCADAALDREMQELGHGCRTGYPDAYRQKNPAAHQLAFPEPEGCSVESELRDDMRPHPATRGKCLLGLERFPEQRSCDGIVPLWMSGDAHARDTGFLDDPRFEDVERSGEFTDGLRRVSGDQQDVLHTAGAQFRESRTQRPRIRHAPHRNMRRREKPGAAYRQSRMNNLRKARMRRMRNV